MTHRRQRPKRPHYSVDIDLDEGNGPVTLDARSLTLPSVAVIAVVTSSVLLTYFLAEERTRLDKRIDSVVTSVERLATSISQLADGLRYGASDRYTATHHAMWCAKTESLNKGFKCPDIGNITSTPTNNLNMTLDGVKTEMETVNRKAKENKTGE